MLSEGLRFRDIRNTSTFRLTLLLGLVAAIGVVALLGLIYGLSARELDSRSDRILRAEAARLEGIPRDRLPDHIRVAIRRSVSGLNYYGLLDREGRPLAGNLRGSSGFVPGHVREIAGRSGRHGPVRLLAVRTAAGETILIGRDVTPLVDLRRRVFEVLAFSGVAIALLILIAGTLLSFAPLPFIGRRVVLNLEVEVNGLCGGSIKVTPTLQCPIELDKSALEHGLGPLLVDPRCSLWRQLVLQHAQHLEPALMGTQLRLRPIEVRGDLFSDRECLRLIHVEQVTYAVAQFFAGFSQPDGMHVALDELQIC